MTARYRLPGPVGGGDAGANTAARVEGQPHTRRHLHITTAWLDEGNAELPQVLLSRRQQEHAPRLAHHEGRLLCRQMSGGHDQVALVLALMRVHHHEEAALSQARDRLVYGYVNAQGRRIRVVPNQCIVCSTIRRRASCASGLS